MQLEQKILVKTKKKETLEEVLKLLEKYECNHIKDNVEKYKTLTFADDVFLDYEFFQYIYKTIKEDGIMIYMETDSNVDPYTSTTYYFGDGVKGDHYDTSSIFYSLLYDDLCIKSWIEKTNIKLTKKEYDRLISLGIEGKGIELALEVPKKEKNSKESIKYKEIDNGYEVVAIKNSLKVVKIKEGTKRINEDAIGYNENLEKIVLPESLQEIPVGLFSEGCPNLKTVTTYEYEELENVIKLPNHIDTIYSDTFRGCGFTNLTIMEGIKEIEAESFDNCENLESVLLPNSLEKINTPFTCCDEFIEYKILDDNKNFLVEDGVLYSKDKTILYDVPNAYKETWFKLPCEVLKFTSAFVCCYNLEKVILNNKVKEIKQFEFDSELKEIVVPPNVEKISINAFNNCKKVEIIGEVGSEAEKYVLIMQNYKLRKTIFTFRSM